MKRITKILLALMLMLTVIPISALNVRAEESKYSHDIQRYLRVANGMEDVPDISAGEVQLTDAEFDDLAKQVTEIKPLRYESISGYIVIFDYKGIENFTNLQRMTVTVNADWHKPRKITNFNLLPQKFIETGSIEIFAGLYDERYNKFYSFEEVYKSNPEEDGTYTRHRLLNDSRTVFVSELVSMSRQYKGAKFDVPLNEQKLHYLFYDFDWMTGLNTNLNYIMEFDLSLTKEQRNDSRFRTVPVHEVEVENQKYYEIDITQNELPNVNVLNEEVYREANANEKSIGVDLRATAKYVDFLAQGTPFTIKSVLSDGREFVADRDYLVNAVEDGSDTYNFYFNFDNNAAITGEIKNIRLLFEASDAAKAKLEEKTEQYNGYLDPMKEAKVYNVSEFIYNDVYVKGLGVPVHSYYRENDKLQDRIDVITPNYLAIIGSKFDVNFNSNGGSTVAPQLGIDEGGHIQIPVVPTKDGYTFEGWYIDNSLTTRWDFEFGQVKNNLTLYAKWDEVIIHKFDVTFDSNGGSTVNPQLQIIEGSLVTEPMNPTKDGFTFEGWYKESTLDSLWNFDTDTVASDITLYAKWAAIPVVEHTVTFDSVGGSTVGPITNVPNDTLITEPTEPTLAGFIFEGWYKEVDYTTAWNFASDKVTSDITLYAKWEAIPVVEHTVTFDSVGGSTVGPITNVPNDTLITEPTEPTLAGYTFKVGTKKLIIQQHGTLRVIK